MPPLEEVVEEAHKPRQSQLNVNQRQSSVSDILNKFTSNSFNRTRNHRITPYSHLTAPFSKQSRIPTPSRIYRSNSFFNSLNAFAGKNSTESVQGEVSQTRPATQPGILRSTSFFNNLSSFASKSSTSNSDAEKSPSRLPTPAGILRSSSLLGHLNTFTSKSASNTSDSDVSQHPPRKRSRKISDRLARTPFFSRPFERVPSSPQTPNKTRQSSVKIKQRGLMKPVHPPLPRSSTVGNLGRAQGQQSSPHTPSFMRPTSSSERRRVSNNATPSSSGSRRGAIATCKQRSTPLPAIYPTRPSTPSKIPTPVKLPSTPSMRLSEMDYSSPTPKTPVTQRRHASLFEVTHSSSAPIIPTMQRRLASRLFPTRKDSLPPSRKHLDSGTTEEMVLDHLKTGGSKRNSVAEHEFDEDKAANTTPDVVGARIDEDEASSASHIDWPAHHAQRARMFSKRTDSIPSAFKKSESYLELAEEDEDARNVMARVHAAHRRRTQGSFLQQTDLVQPTLKESDSYHESVGEQASSTTIEGGETPRGRRSPGLLPNDETGDEVTADLHPLASSTGDTSSDECSHDLAEEDFPSLARRIRDTNNRKTKPDSFNVRVIATPNSDKTIYDEEHRILTGIHFIVKGKLISRSKPCRCGSGRKFKKCCGLVIRTEAEELYGDLDALARRIGFVAIDLENSTRKSYAQRDAEEEAKGTAQEEESMATAQEEGSEDNEDNEDTVGGYNITYTAGGRPLAPNEPCLCLSENKFKDCCMPKLNKQAERDHGEILEELQRQGRTVNLVLEIEDPDKAKSPESDTTIGPTDRADTEEREFVAAHPGPDSFSMRHVFDAQPNPVWLGRYISLDDHFHNLALPSQTQSIAEAIAHPMNDDVRRDRRIFIHLQNLCMTEEARESLADFKATKEGHKRRAQENIGQPKGRIIKAKKGFFEKLKGKHGGEVSGT